MVPVWEDENGQWWYSEGDSEIGPFPSEEVALRSYRNGQGCPTCEE